MAELADAAALIAAFGVGSLGTAILARAREERGARAAVLSALHDLESRRWYDPDGRPFGAALREFRSAALVGRLPARVVDEYAVSAQAAAWLSADNWKERGGSDEYASGISSDVADIVRAHSRVIAYVTWHPFLGRLRQPLLLRSMRAQVATLPEKHRGLFERSRKYG